MAVSIIPNAVRTVVAAQPPLPPGLGDSNSFKSIVMHAAIGGLVGSAAGFGVSFLTLPFVGVVAAPIAAAIGGALGVLAGATVGYIRAHHGTQLPPQLPSGWTTVR